MIDETKYSASLVLKVNDINEKSYYYFHGTTKVVRRSLQIDKINKINDAIKKIFDQSNKTYGTRRIQVTLEKQNIKLSRNTVDKYRRNLGLTAIRKPRKKRFRPATGQDNRGHLIAPRLFKIEDKIIPTQPSKLLTDWGHVMTQFLQL